MKLVIDNSIPFVEGLFEPYAQVVYRNGGQIAHNDILDADALIIRTSTRCNAALLDGTSVKMIATASVGTDHIDLAYCQHNGINVSSAAGCNAGAVANYVFSAMYGCAARKSIPLTGRTIGIIGAGSTGQRVEATARLLGFKVLVYDPPRAAAEGWKEVCSLQELLAGSDIITLHAPLNDSTRHLCNESFFDAMKYGAFFINTARGELVDDRALMEAIPKLGPVILDVWNGEPEINRALMDRVDIATPHISGYSLQAKLASAIMVVRAVSRFFGFTELYEFVPSGNVETMSAVHVDVNGLTQGQKASIFQYNYPIFTDDFMLRMAPENFASLRLNYSYRREFFID